MGRTDCVESNLLQNGDFAVLTLIEGDSAKHSVIVMDASAFQFHCFSIDTQSTPDICGHGPDPEKHGRFVDRIFCVRNKMCFKDTQIRDSGVEPIEIGSFDIPEHRMFQSKINVCGIG